MKTIWSDLLSHLKFLIKRNPEWSSFLVKHLVKRHKFLRRYFFNLKLKQNAIAPFSTPKHRWAFKELKQFAEQENIPFEIPYADLSDEQKRAILKGKGNWRGVDGFFKWKERKKSERFVHLAWNGKA